jgi:hypothetical protein
MSPVRLDRAAPPWARSSWVVLLCAVALGILGMHGLVSGAGGPEAGHGHHPAPAIVTQADDAAPASESAGSPAVGDNDPHPPAGDAGMLALCLMVLTPVVAVGLWLRAKSRAAGWRLRRLIVRAVTAAVDVPPHPPNRQLTVLRI